MKSLSLKLPDEIQARLLGFAKRKGLSKSEVVRRALTAYLEGQGTRPKASVLELALDLAGSLDGPADLSVFKGGDQGKTD